MAAIGARRAHKPRYRIGATRIAALALLLVLVTGLSVTSFTRGWIGSLPYHDHLTLGARALGTAHHAHHGDPLDQAQRALRSVGATPAAAQPEGQGVVSLRPLSAQPELNGFTASGWVGGGGLPLPPEAGFCAFVATLLLARGRRAAPPAPPPRPA